MAAYEEILGELRPAVKHAAAAVGALLAVEEPSVRRAVLLYLLVTEVYRASGGNALAAATVLQGYEDAIRGESALPH